MCPLILSNTFFFFGSGMAHQWWELGSKHAKLPRDHHHRVRPRRFHYRSRPAAARLLPPPRLRRLQPFTVHPNQAHVSFHSDINYLNIELSTRWGCFQRGTLLRVAITIPCRFFSFLQCHSLQNNALLSHFAELATKQQVVVGWVVNKIGSATLSLHKM